MDKLGKILSKKWEDYDGRDKSVVDFGVLSAKEVSDFCCKAWDDWKKYKLRDINWLKRQLFFKLRSSFNQGPKYFLSAIKGTVRVFKS